MRTSPTINIISFLLILAIFSSCATYKANIMFKTGDLNSNLLKQEISETEKNYVISKNDYLKVEVFTNKGERIIDPNYELMSSEQNQINRERPSPQYLVDKNGNVKLPVIGTVYLENYTIRQADSVLEQLYAEYYKDPYVTTSYVNKRVIVLGATGGKVIPIQNESINLLEILALAGGIDNNGKSYNIRLIRGPLNDPTVQVIDLSTIEGMKKANLKVESGDIVYVEPVRRVMVESIRDIAPILGVIANVLTLIIVIQNL